MKPLCELLILLLLQALAVCAGSPSRGGSLPVCLLSALCARFVRKVCFAVGPAVGVVFFASSRAVTEQHIVQKLSVCGLTFS